jgi:hypothetical protein
MSTAINSTFINFLEAFSLSFLDLQFVNLDITDINAINGVVSTVTILRTLDDVSDQVERVLTAARKGGRDTTVMQVGLYQSVVVSLCYRQPVAMTCGL